MLVWIQCSFFTLGYMLIHMNTYQYLLLQNFGLKYVINTFMLVLIVFIFIVSSNKSKIHANTSQYRPNTFMTNHKPVVVEGPVLVCISMYFVWSMYLLVLVCIGGPQRVTTTTGSCSCCIACIACIGMYEYVFRMYSYVFFLYIQALYKQIRTYRPILT